MILGTSATVLALGAIAVLVYDTVNTRHNLASQVATMAEITGANSAAAMGFFNTSDAQETLDVLEARADLDFACLYTTDGKPFVWFSRDTTKLDYVPPLTLDIGTHFFDNKMIHVHRIDFRGDPAGFIAIHLNLQKQQARARVFLLIAVVTLFALTGVALLIAAWLQRLVSAPIAHLASVAQHITKKKDYSIRASGTGRDEVGGLVAAFNQMLTEIERQNRVLQASENRLKLALAAAQMGTWEWNLQRNTVSWSPESDAIFARSGNNISMDDYTRMIHPDDAERVIHASTRAVNDRTVLETEFRILHPDGAVTWVAKFGRVQYDTQGTPLILAGIVQNISERKKAETEHQKLVARLLHSEDAERRRIARELHDTTAQHLVAIKMILVRLTHEVTTTQPLSSKEVTECVHLVEQALQETRTLTYLLHPPMLDEFGLVGALRDFAAGMARRSGVRVRVAFDGYSGRLSQDIELALFRVIQESLTNAIRHSGSNDISIRLERDEHEVRVEVQDSGRGLPNNSTNPDAKQIRKTGVGIAAMHERLALVGGYLTVESDAQGVTVLAIVPLPGTLQQPEPNNGEKSP